MMTYSQKHWKFLKNKQVSMDEIKLLSANWFMSQSPSSEVYTFFTLLEFLHIILKHRQFLPLSLCL